MSNKASSGEENCKLFIVFLDDYCKFQALHKMLLKTRTCIKNYKFFDCNQFLLSKYLSVRLQYHP